MSKLAIIADSDITDMFSGFGFDGFSVANSDQAKKALGKICGGGYQICYITEFFAKDILDDIKNISQDKIFPIITIISDHREKLDIASNKIKLATIRAVGTSI